jgi:hypothetical protein
VTAKAKNVLQQAVDNIAKVVDQLDKANTSLLSMSKELSKLNEQIGTVLDVVQKEGVKTKAI